jgi:hypothetical protein
VKSCSDPLSAPDPSRCTEQRPDVVASNDYDNLTVSTRMRVMHCSLCCSQTRQLRTECALEAALTDDV